MAKPKSIKTPHILVKDQNASLVSHFFGREEELAKFADLDSVAGGKILVVYGRRRVGKTTLIKKAFANRRLLVFEGLEGQDEAEQLQHFAEQLAEHFNDQKLSRIKLNNWREAFKLLWEFISNGIWTVHLEELQWMANYRNELVSDLKYIWDNYWQKNSQLTAVLCGSAPSFLIESVMRSKALHNRSQWEFPIGELPFSQASKLMGDRRAPTELLDGYLAVGGIPEYAKLLSTESSIYLSLARHSFSKGGFFVHEAERVFISNLAKKPQYRAIIETLAKDGASTQAELLKKIHYPSGGGAAELFEDLTLCEFIYSYSPLGFGERTRENKWMIRDSCLQLYFRLIKPKLAAIQRGEYSKSPSKALSHMEYRKWLGLSFERFCLFNHRAIAGVLGFSGVEYRVGPFYRRGAQTSMQLDLVFQRKDKVITVCEIKYLTEAPGKEVVSPFEKSLALLTKLKSSSIQKVLISPNGATPSLEGEGYFDEIITLEHLRPRLN